VGKQERAELVYIARHKLIKLFQTNSAMVPALARNIWNEPYPKTAIQHKQFWPIIREWEFSKDKSYESLLNIARKHKPEDMFFLDADTPSLWVHRYYFYRISKTWNVQSINRSCLKVRFKGWETNANYHIHYDNTSEIGFVYFKSGKRWTNEHTIGVLSSIKLYYIQSLLSDMLFKEDMQVRFIYVSLNDDYEYELTTDHYRRYIKHLEKHYPEMERARRDENIF
jgi:hypothetical protein